MKVKEPANVSDVRRFVGMANQLGKFTPHLAELTKPLCDLFGEEKHLELGSTSTEGIPGSEGSAHSKPSTCLV